MDITPELHLLISSSNENLGWHDALSELIDNFEKRDFIGSWGTIMHELKFEGHGNGK